MKNSAKPEEFDLSRWSVPQLKELKPGRLHRFTQHVIGTLAASRILLGRCLLAIEATGLYANHGFSDAVHYATSHGIGEREAGEARRTARYLEQLPKLSQAAEKGRVSWSALKAITPKATVDTEQRWLEIAEQTTVRTLEKMAARTGHGELPGEAGESARTQPKEANLNFQVAIEVATLFQQAVRDLCQAMGQVVTANQAFEILVVHFHTGASHADDGTVKKILAAAHRDVEAMEQREEREFAAALNDIDDEQVEDAPTWVKSDGSSIVCEGDGGLCAWAATVTKLRDNSESELKLVSRARSRIRYNPKARGVTPGQRRQLLRRDGYCCSAPGCRRHLWLDVHHVFYCHQGPTVPENLVILCQRCHKNVHNGDLRVSGRAPDRLRWRDRSGNALGIFRGYRAVPGLKMWFSRGSDSREYPNQQGPER